MSRRLFFIIAPLALLSLFFLSLVAGPVTTSVAEVYAAFTQSEPQNYTQAVILYQRLPRALIALYVGAVMACSGLVFQALLRNPLGSSSSLGINAGAVLFTVASAVLLNFGLALQGVSALAGGVSGFLSSRVIARLAGSRDISPGLLLILAGSLISMLYLGIANAILLAHPDVRSEYLGWLSGTVNNAYIDRLRSFWWFGLFSLALLFWLARALTLMLLGNEKALSMGINTKRVSCLALAAAIVAASSGVAICGPIGFVGLMVPHAVRPLVGQHFLLALPACILLGAFVCLAATLGAQTLFQPYIVHTGVLLDLLGGMFFIWVIKTHYLSTTLSKTR